MILSVVLHGYEAWSLTLWKERRLSIFEKRILRRIFGHKRDQNEDWRSLPSNELHSLYRLPNKIVREIKSGRMRLAGYVVRLGKVVVLRKF